MCTYTDIENIIKKVKKKLLFTETKLSIILKLKEFPAALFNFVFLLIILQLLLPPAISSTDCEKNYSFQKNCQVYADKNIMAIFINYLKKKSRLSADDFGVGIFLKKTWPSC